jgi:hypothetical protein
MKRSLLALLLQTDTKYVLWQDVLYSVRGSLPVQVALPYLSRRARAWRGTGSFEYMYASGPAMESYRSETTACKEFSLLNLPEL